MSEPTFYCHCDDDPSCDLGYTEYECPVCGGIQSDYADLWFLRNRVYGGGTVASRCPTCGASLLMSRDEEGFPTIEEASP